MHALEASLEQAAAIDDDGRRADALRSVATEAASGSDEASQSVALRASILADFADALLVPGDAERVAAYDAIVRRLEQSGMDVPWARLRAQLYRARVAKDYDTIEQLAAYALQRWRDTDGLAFHSELADVLESSAESRLRARHANTTDFAAALEAVVSDLGRLDRYSKQDQQNSVARALLEIAEAKRGHSPTARTRIYELIIETFSGSGWRSVLSVVASAFIELAEIHAAAKDAGAVGTTLARFRSLREDPAAISGAAFVRITRLWAALADDRREAIRALDETIERFAITGAPQVLLELAPVITLKAQLLSELYPVTG